MDKVTVATLHARVIDVFERAVCRTLDHDDRPNHPDNHVLIFTLPLLHAWVDPDGQFDFPVFQRALYRGDLNRQLNTRGLLVELHESVGTVAENRYRLVQTSR